MVSHCGLLFLIARGSVCGELVRFLDPSKIHCHSQDDRIVAKAHLREQRMFHAGLLCVEDIARVSP